MTSDIQHGCVLFECDSCDEVFEGERGEDYAVIWASARGVGWKVRKVRDDWVHACPKCKV